MLVQFLVKSLPGDSQQLGGLNLVAATEFNGLVDKQFLKVIDNLADVLFAQAGTDKRLGSRCNGAG